MNQEMCGTARELIPDFVGSRLSPSEVEVVERHVASCGDCVAELRLARAILVGRPAAPDGLLESLLRSVRQTRRQPVRPWWGVAAAAVAALALGIGLSSDTSYDASLDVPGFAYEMDEGDVWLSDDGLVAGAPLFDGLSDDALLELLDELSVASAGGSA